MKVRLLNGCRIGLLALACGWAAQGHAAIAYQESVSGDLSGFGLSPTVIAVSTGSNEIYGSTGNPGSGVDRDYFTITVPVGMTFESLTLLPGTSVSGGASFLGLEAGSQVTVPTSAGDATGLLGYVHYSSGDVGSDLFPTLSFAFFGSSGFKVPLGPGQYSFWVQDFGPAPISYGFDVKLAGQPVPEPATVVGLVAGLAIGAGVMARRRPTRT